MSSARKGNEQRQSVCQPVSPSGTCPVERRAKTVKSRAKTAILSGQNSQFVEPRQAESSQDSQSRAKTVSLSVIQSIGYWRCNLILEQVFGWLTQRIFKLRLVGSTDFILEGCRESRRRSRDTYKESNITKYTSIRRPKRFLE